MEVIIDTNALSAIAEYEPGAADVFSGAENVVIPVIVLGEYLFGIAQSRRKADHELWVKHVMRSMVVLDVNADTAAVTLKSASN